MEGQLGGQCNETVRNEGVQTVRQRDINKNRERREMCQNRRRLRHFLSCGLVYDYWEHKSLTSIHTSSTALHTTEHIHKNKQEPKIPFCCSWITADSRDMQSKKSKTNCPSHSLFTYQKLSLIQHLYESALEIHCFTIT